MTDGLIVREPYATHLVTGRKKFEFRTTKLPKDKIGVVILIATTRNDGNIICGHVIFSGQKKNTEGWTWIVEKAVQYSEPRMYEMKPGCIIWIKDIQFLSKVVE